MLAVKFKKIYVKTLGAKSGTHALYPCSQQRLLCLVRCPKAIERIKVPGRLQQACDVGMNDPSGVCLWCRQQLSALAQQTVLSRRVQPQHTCIPKMMTADYLEGTITIVVYTTTSLLYSACGMVKIAGSIRMMMCCV